MSESPDRIWVIKEDVAASWPGSFRRFLGSDLNHGENGTEYVRADIAASQIAEVRQPQVTDDPATVTYGRLLHRHMKAARRNFAGDDRKRIFTLIEMFRAEFPSECEVWESRYADRGGNDAP